MYQLVPSYLPSQICSVYPGLGLRLCQSRHGANFQEGDWPEWSVLSYRRSPTMYGIVQGDDVQMFNWCRRSKSPCWRTDSWLSDSPAVANWRDEKGRCSVVWVTLLLAPRLALRLGPVHSTCWFWLTEAETYKRSCWSEIRLKTWKWSV